MVSELKRPISAQIAKSGAQGIKIHFGGFSGAGGAVGAFFLEGVEKIVFFGKKIGIFF